MADATDIMKELQTCVGQELKAVTFKWLARRFSVPVNEAKQTLFAFAEKHRASVKATYLLSGWTSEEPRRHVVHLVAPEQLSTARQALRPVTSMHVYSVQPSAPKDSSELWNEDALQAGELFQQLFKEGESNCLANNSWSAVLCPEAMRDPSRSRKRPAPAAQEAAQPSSSGKHAAGKAGGMTMEAKLNGVLAGGTASKQGVAAASVAVRISSGGSEAGEAPAAKEAEPAAAAPPAKAPAASRPASGKSTGKGSPGKGKTSPAGKASGAGGAQGKQVLANMWSKAAPKKEKPAAAKGTKAVPTAKANPSRRAQAVIPDDSSEDEEEAAPEEAEAAVESDDEDEMPVAKRPRSAGGQRRTILDESDEDDFEPPLAKPAPKKASGSKKAAKQPSAKKKGKKAAKDSEGEESGDDVVVDMDVDEEAAESLSVRKKSKRAEMPALKPGTVKAGEVATGKRRKVTRETYNDKGEEVTEEVWEDADGAGQGDAQAAPAAAGKSAPAATPSQQKAAAEGGAKAKQALDGSPSKPAAKAAPPSSKGKPASGRAKKGKNVQIAGQQGIASFFGKK